MNIKEILFETKITLLSANTYIVEGTIGISGKIHAPTLFLIDTGAGPSFIPRSIVPPSSRDHI